MSRHAEMLDMGVRVAARFHSHALPADGAHVLQAAADPGGAAVVVLGRRRRQGQSELGGRRADPGAGDRRSAGSQLHDADAARAIVYEVIYLRREILLRICRHIVHSLTICWTSNGAWNRSSPILIREC